MKICFVISPAKTFDRVPERVYGCTFTYYIQQPIPILYVAAVLEKEGYKVELKDFTDNNSWSEFTQFVDSANFDIYIFHTVLLAESIDIKAARYILHNTSAMTVFYGPHSTLEAENFLLNERCYVARGDAEFIIRDLVRKLETGNPGDVKGITYIDNGGIVENETYGVIENLDSLPFPARGVVKKKKGGYFNPKLTKRPVSLVLTSRGCSFRCYYCVPNAISWARELEWKRFHDGQKPPVRLRSPKNIIEEFAEIKKMGYKAVSVIDDMFLFGGKKRIIEICQGLKKVSIPFGFLARCDLITDEEMVTALREAGCQYIDLGIESFDQKVLDDIKKDLDVSKIRKTVDLLNKYGIEPKANIMFGASPVETKRSLEDTIKKVSGLQINYCMFSIATPFPGTEFYSKARKENWVVEGEIDNLEENLSPTKKSLITYPNLSKKELEKAIIMANRRFYLAPKRILYQLKKVKSLRSLKDLILTGWQVIR